ncbi:DoxX family protein [Nocardia sp. CT2-14]|uniref:DoxX family protein n=2 Tax=Nocardia aurantiaca TaxID=2675850 RepID=A0A6I3KYN5_9NOCA|nr:DoxX family protein [Nocardia aurantiaca]
MSLLTADTAADLAGRDPGVVTEWKPATRILFRFGFLYFSLFCLLYPQPIYAFLGVIHQWLPDNTPITVVNAYREPVKWVGRTVFGAEVALNPESGSGDQAYLWVIVFCVLMLALAGAVVWSILDRRRTEYRRLAGWFLLFIRLCLAGQMLGYGFAKLIPTQMPVPPLDALIQPLGDVTHPAMLWLQVGTSPVYEMLLGAAEVLGGILLLIPRATLAGVLLSLVSMAQVWILNMTFDIPVKLLSFHLMLLCLVLLAPEARRLTAVLTGSATGPATTPEPLDSARGRRIVAIAQVAMLIWFLIGEVTMSVKAYNDWGPGRPKSELYGIWTVTEFVRDGQPVPPLATDENRWQRMVFDNPQIAAYQRMDDTVTTVGARIDGAAHKLVLQSGGGHAEGPQTLATFTFERQAPDRLVLTGDLSGHPVAITMRQVDERTIRLRQGGIHFIQDVPRFN